MCPFRLMLAIPEIRIRNHFPLHHTAFPSHLLCFPPLLPSISLEEGKKERERGERGKVITMVMVVVAMVAAFTEPLSHAKDRDEGFTHMTSSSHQKG